MSMIIVQLLGGLGNQLFQYALGRSLAEKLQAELKLDVTAFKDYTLRSYALQHYNIVEAFATPEEIATLRGDGTSTIPHVTHVLKEKGFPFNPDVFKLSGSAYLEGYWQSEKYFKDIEPIIRREFTLKEPLLGEDLQVATAIQGVPSISLHVRRGDYVTNAHTNQYHGTCSLAYYQKCLTLLQKTIPDPNVFVFSDDPQWVKDNLKFDLPTTYVTHNPPEKHYQDLRLMSLCKHNILANSSFSWWGAWLNANPTKQVLAPRRWFAEASIDTRDLTPATWRRTDATQPLQSLRETSQKVMKKAARFIRRVSRR